MRSTLRALCLALPAMLAAGAVEATPTTALYLAMDGSGSISSTDFTTQVNAYSAALTNFFTNNPSAYGQVAIGGEIFGANQLQFFPVTTITSTAVLTSLTNAISALNPARGGINTGATAIGTAITLASNALTTFSTGQGGGLKLIVDVTTDGQNNLGTDPATVAQSLVPGTLSAVNCLGLGTVADCSFVTGVGTNYGNVTFAAMASALTNKIQTEVVPEPTTMAVLGLSALALGAARRRRQG